MFKLRVEIPGFEPTERESSARAMESEVSDVTMITNDMPSSHCSEDFGTDSYETLSEESSSVVSTDRLSFLSHFSGIPSIEDIELSIDEEESSLRVPKKSEQNIYEDEGTFVDPLTGAVIPSAATLVFSHKEIEDFVVEEGEEEEQPSSEWEDDDLLKQPELIADVDLKEIQMADEMEFWYDRQPDRDVKFPDKIDFIALKDDEEKDEILEIAKGFLGDLIDNIVERCEVPDTKLILRRNLDKTALMSELDNVLTNLEVEQKAHSFLHRKVVEHFKRKKIFRYIIEESLGLVTGAAEKYRNVRNNLHDALERENQLKIITGEKTFLLSRQIDLMEHEIMQQHKSLAVTMRKHLCRESFARLNKVVEHELSKMDKLCNEVAEVRYSFIQQQHNLAVLVEQSEKMAHIGDGLNIYAYETLLSETQFMGKKTEDQDEDLTKLQKTYMDNLHTRAHIQEKILCIKDKLKHLERIYEELQEHKKQCREEILDMRKRRAKLIREYREKSFQNGLADKPLLLADYDQTVERVKSLRLNVKKLRQKQDEMEKRLGTMQNRMSLNLNLMLELGSI